MALLLILLIGERPSRLTTLAHTAAVKILTVGAAAVLLILDGAPAANAQPVSERHSESPYIEGFYRQLEAQGFGHLDDIDGNNLFNTVAWNACKMNESTSLSESVAVHVVANGT